MRKMHYPKSVLSIIVLAGLGLAAAQVNASQPVNWDSFKAFLTPETWAVIVFYLAGWVTIPITSMFKHWFKTEGVQTERVNYVVSAVLSGLLPFVLGAYGYSWAGLAYAVTVSVLRALVDQGEVKQRARDAAKGVALAHHKQPELLVVQAHAGSDNEYINQGLVDERIIPLSSYRERE